MGWHTVSIDGMDTDEVRARTRRGARRNRQAIVDPGAHHHRFRIAQEAGTFGVHGSPLGPDEVAATKENLGWPAEPAFYLPDEALSYFREAVERGRERQSDWETAFDAYSAAHPELAAEFTQAMAGELPAGWDADLPTWNLATRQSPPAKLRKR